MQSNNMSDRCGKIPVMCPPILHSAEYALSKGISIARYRIIEWRWKKTRTVVKHGSCLAGLTGRMKIFRNQSPVVERVFPCFRSLPMQRHSLQRPWAPEARMEKPYSLTGKHWFLTREIRQPGVPVCPEVRYYRISGCSAPHGRA